MRPACVAALPQILFNYYSIGARHSRNSQILCSYCIPLNVLNVQSQVGHLISCEPIITVFTDLLGLESRVRDRYRVPESIEPRSGRTFHQMPVFATLLEGPEVS